MKEDGSRVSSCLKRRLERLWRGRLYGRAPGSLRGGLSLRKRRRNAVKCDNLSFLRVFLAQIDSVRGGANGYVPLLGGGCPGAFRELLFSAAVHHPVAPLSAEPQFPFFNYAMRLSCLLRICVDVGTLDVSTLRPRRNTRFRITAAPLPRALCPAPSLRSSPCA